MLSGIRGIETVHESFFLAKVTHFFFCVVSPELPSLYYLVSHGLSDWLSELMGEELPGSWGNKTKTYLAPKSQTYPLSRLEGDVGPHAPGDAGGPCTDLLRRPWQQELGEKTTETKELTLDHPLQVKLELDLLAGVDDVDELEEVKEEAQRCQRPKRPHQNFHFQPRQCPNIRKLSHSTMTDHWPTITEYQENSF